MGFGTKRTASAAEAQPDLAAGLARALRRPAAPAAGQAGSDQEPEGTMALAAALVAIDRTARLVREAAERVIEAAGEPDAGARALLAERYDDARRKVDALSEASEASPLTGPGAQSLSVPLRGATYVVAPFPLSTAEGALDLPAPEGGFDSHAEVAEVLRRVETALERIGRARAVYAQDRDFLAGRPAGTRRAA